MKVDVLSGVTDVKQDITEMEGHAMSIEELVTYDDNDMPEYLFDQPETATVQELEAAGISEEPAISQTGEDCHSQPSKSPISPIPPESPDGKIGGNENEEPDGGDGDSGVFGVFGDIGELEGGRLPTFSDSILDKLATFFQEIGAYGESPQETDALLLVAIAVLSSCMPNVEGIYDGRRVFANIFVFISAKASSGKGRLSLCSKLVQPIHRRLKEMYKEKKAIYDLHLSLSKTGQTVMPVRPKQTMLFIPADTSATAVYQLLNENEGRGIVFETEADALSETFKSDFGNYSNGFRRAFHHEKISYHRRTGDEDVEVETPRLSTVLTGTVAQVKSLIKSPENGLFSRFAFYRLISELRWKDVLGNQGGEALDVKFDDLGMWFTEFYDTLVTLPKIVFSVTDSQRQKFNSYFSALQQLYYGIFKDDVVASVRRLGLICFRIAMVLSVIRLMDTGECPEQLVCDDEDFDSALAISRVLAIHMARVFDELTATDNSRSASLLKSSDRQQFFDALPTVFSRKEFMLVAESAGIPSSTAEKWIRYFCAESGPLEKIKHGQYRKKG